MKKVSNREYVLLLYMDKLIGAWLDATALTLDERRQPRIPQNSTDRYASDPNTQLRYFRVFRGMETFRQRVEELNRHQETILYAFCHPRCLPQVS